MVCRGVCLILRVVCIHSSFLCARQAEDNLGELQQEMESQKNLLRQQAMDEKHILDEKYKELKMDYNEMKARVEELDVKVI